MLNFEMGKKVAAGGFALMVLESVMWLLQYLVGIHVNDTFADVIYFAGIFIAAAGFAVMFLDKRDTMDLLTAASLGLMFVLKLFFLSELYAMLPLLIYRLVHNIHLIPMILNAKKCSNPSILFLLVCALLYGVIGYEIVIWLFFDVLTWYELGSIVSIGGAIVATGICLLYSLDRK